MDARTKKSRQSQGGKNKSRLFKLSVCVHLSDNVKKTYAVKAVDSEMTIKTLKSNVELITGIPFSFQRLHYIDDGELFDDQRLSAYDIVPGAQLKLKLWLMWESLITAVILGDTEKVFKLGVTKDSDYEAPRLQYADSKQLGSKQLLLAERGAIALFVAACYGHTELCNKLIKTGANVNWRSPITQRAPLHVAAAMGQNTAIGLLLNNGADIKAVDSDGQTAISLASKFGQKSCERQLVQFTWQRRAASSKQHKAPPPLFPHQRFDSALQANLVDGPEAQVYRPQLVPPGEFGGTGLDAPRRKVKTPSMVRDGLLAQSRSASAPSSSASPTYVFYDFRSPTDFLALAGDDINDTGTNAGSTAGGAAGGTAGGPADGGAGDNSKPTDTSSSSRAALATQQRQRHLLDDNGDLIMAVIHRKMREQQEKGLGGLPYDLWLAIAERPELFQALKRRGQLDAVLPE